VERRDVVKAMAAAAILPGVRLRQAPDWTAWRVDGTRLNGWIDHLAGIGHGPDGWVRTGFSDAVIQARQYAMGLMRAAELDVSIDPAGNIIGRRAGSDPTLKPILFGSHVDSVMNGGNYDGIVGSLGAIAAATALAERTYRNRHPLWVTIWCDEESGLTGSRGFLGDISADELARPGRDGVPLGDKIKRIGGDPAAMASYRHGQGDLAGYLELHIEQGGTLEKKGLQIGVVEGIVGIRSWDVTITGFANHAGTTPMDERHNALLAAAELILAVDRIVRAEPGRQVGTVGRLLVKPNAQNVIPGEVIHTIELRDLSMDKLARLWEAIRAEGDRIMARREVTWTHVERPINVAALSDPSVRDLIAESARTLGLSNQVMPSGAGHDAQDLAKLGPMGMIFVPSIGGISHSPKEFTRPDDVTNGANVLLQSVLRLDRR
jgi:beta-ureidopropionase / N-carbamoyl-L-amino-acid hydrolase